MAAVGGGAGIVLAGPIVSHLDYHWLFWIPLIITVIAAICAQLFVPESPVRTPGRISWLAAVLLSAWLVALLVAVSEAPTWGWGSTQGDRADRGGRRPWPVLGRRRAALTGAARSTCG